MLFLYVIFSQQPQYIHGFHDKKDQLTASDNALYSTFVYIGCTVLASVMFFKRKQQEKLDTIHLNNQAQNLVVELEELSSPLMNLSGTEQSNAQRAATSERS